MYDVIQNGLLSTLIFFLLGCVAYSWLSRLLPVLKRYLLPPRYLKSTGVWLNKHSSAQVKKK